jgi:glycosyltransferase involved in cell wall biosynthesis
VLLGSDFFWPSVGGCELFIEDLGRQLIGAGYEVHHVCRHLPERASLTHEGIHIAPFDCTGRFCDRAFGPGYEAYKNFLSSARYEAAFFIGQPDIWLMAPLLENPVPHTRCCLIPIINTMLLDEWRSRNEFELVAAVLRNASLCIALTEAGMDHQFLKKIAANTCFLPHAIPAYPEMPDFRMRHELASDIPLIVHVGNYWPLKNQLSLLEQLRPLAGDWQLALIGHQLPWPEESRYYDMVAALAAADPRVRPLGGLVAPEADAAIAAADVFVLPSKAEARPLVILQAMRHGIPWVATPECNSVHDDAGGVVAPLEHFSAVIRTLLDNPDYREALGALGRRHWQECCSWGVILPRFLEILAEGRPAVDLVMPPNLRKNNDRLRQRILSASNLACASG